MAAIDPRAGILASLHYTTFSGTDGIEPFQTEEAERRRRLARRPGVDGAGADAMRELGWIKLFDHISLALCLAPPGADPEGVPAWLETGGWSVPEGPGDVTLEVEWRGPDVVTFRPYPFRGRFRMEIPFRELTAVEFPDREAMTTAWREGEERAWTLTMEE